MSAGGGRFFDFDVDEKSEPQMFSRSRDVLSHGLLRAGRGRGKGRHVKTPEEKLKSSIAKKEHTKKRREKKRRLIIRNLSFSVKEEDLKDILSKFGSVVELTIPKKQDGAPRGFAFAQFDNFKSSMQAIKNLNFKKLHGRPIAIDYAISKSKYDHIISSRKVTEPNEASKSSEDEEESESSAKDVAQVKDEEESESGTEQEPESEKKHRKKVGKKEMSEEDLKVSRFLEECGFDSQSDDDSNDSHASESDSSDDDDDKSEDEEEERNSMNSSANQQKSDSSVTIDTQSNKTSSKDIHEGKTVFMRNISFETTDENLKEAMSEFGTISYCLMCIDPVTEMPRGTAFIKFDDKADAEKLIARSNSENGIFLDGRRLYCASALSREEVQKIPSGNLKEKKDKRNLHLLKEGLIMTNSEEAKDLSPADRAKRAKLEIVKKQKLKNLNFFVSPTRLCVHNIPPSFNDLKLRKLFLNATGEKAVVTEARIMMDMQKLNARGEAKSKRFGFVAFSRHESALLALKELDNHPSAFHPQSRPIVEFAIENHLALLSKKRRQEKSRLKNKAKCENNEEMNVEASSTVGHQNEDVKKKKRKYQKSDRTEKNESATAEPTAQRNNQNSKRKRRNKRVEKDVNVTNEKQSLTPSKQREQRHKKNMPIGMQQTTEPPSPKSNAKKGKPQKMRKKGKKVDVQSFRHLVNNYKTKLMGVL